MCAFLIIPAENFIFIAFRHDAMLFLLQSGSGHAIMRYVTKVLVLSARYPLEGIQMKEKRNILLGGYTYIWPPVTQCHYNWNRSALTQSANC
jgi:hypothetical protein